MSITLVRADTAGARDSITAYLADASRNIEEGSVPAIQPPSEGQLQQEVNLPQQEPAPKRPRGRPPKPRSSVQSPKKPRGKLTDEQRASVIRMYQKGHSLADIAETFGISRSHAYTVGKSGQIRAKPRGGTKNLKMTQEASVLLDQELQKNPQSTGKELVKVLSEHNIQVKPSTVNKHLISGAMVR